MSQISGSFNLTKSVVARIRQIANKTTKDRGYTRTYYSYPAKFLSQLPHELIRMFSVKGDLIYDAFCGGGTTGLEAMILERRSMGYDINPFAILIARVKTQRLDLEKLGQLKPKVIDLKRQGTKRVMDDEDESLLGPRISSEVSKIAANIERLDAGEGYGDFFKLALIHSIKMVGRRDFRKRLSSKDQSSMTAFFQTDSVHPPGPSIVPSFNSKVNAMIRQMVTLPNCSKYAPTFVNGSNYNTFLKDESVDLIITSPPYKDLDVEYIQIQIQRPESHRSKRSDVIAKIMNAPIVDKDRLCGYRGNEYWENLQPSLRECHRVSKPQSLAFFWIGFKTSDDNDKFQRCLEENGFPVLESIRVKLSKDRAASSRSIHHGRETNMLKNDWLFIARRD